MKFRDNEISPIIVKISHLKWMTIFDRVSWDLILSSEISSVIVMKYKDVEDVVREWHTVSIEISRESSPGYAWKIWKLKHLVERNNFFLEEYTEVKITFFRFIFNTLKLISVDVWLFGAKLKSFAQFHSKWLLRFSIGLPNPGFGVSCYKLLDPIMRYYDRMFFDSRNIA